MVSFHEGNKQRYTLQSQINDQVYSHHFGATVKEAKIISFDVNLLGKYFQAFISSSVQL